MGTPWQTYETVGAVGTAACASLLPPEDNKDLLQQNWLSPQAFLPDASSWQVAELRLGIKGAQASAELHVFQPINIYGKYARPATKWKLMQPCGGQEHSFNASLRQLPSLPELHVSTNLKQLSTQQACSHCGSHLSPSPKALIASTGLIRL